MLRLAALSECVDSPSGATSSAAAEFGLTGGGGARGLGEPDGGSDAGTVSAEAAIDVDASPARVVSLAVLTGSSTLGDTGPTRTKVLSLDCASRKKALPKKTLRSEERRV